MELEKIEALLEKYWEGETTLAEERQLKAFFNQADVPAHLKIFQSQFRFFSEAAEEKIVFKSDFEQTLADSILADFPAPQVIKMSANPPSENKVRPLYTRWAMGVAASVVLIVVSFYAGRNTQSIDNKAIAKDVKDLKTTVEMLAKLKEESASERIKGVSYASEIKSKGKASEQAVEALIKTLNTDENTNVRLAALNALFIYTDLPKVREALVESMQIQEDPAIKIALINMMIGLKEKKAKKTIEDFIAKEPIPEKIKENIRKELQAL
jgi:HEAT repeats